LIRHEKKFLNEFR